MLSDRSALTGLLNSFLRSKRGKASLRLQQLSAARGWGLTAEKANLSTFFREVIAVNTAWLATSISTYEIKEKVFVKMVLCGRPRRRRQGEMPPGKHDAKTTKWEVDRLDSLHAYIIRLNQFCSWFTSFTVPFLSSLNPVTSDLPLQPAIVLGVVTVGL